MTDERLRYLVVAGTCALLHNAVMIGSDGMGVHYLPATGVSYALVAGCGYALHSRFTFNRQMSTSSFVRYATGMAMNFPAAVALMFVFRDLAGQPAAIAAPISTMLLFLWSFAASRWAIGTSRGRLR